MSANPTAKDERMSIEENGPWAVASCSDGGICIESDDFAHDVALKISGCFSDRAEKLEYAHEIARRLNAYVQPN